jgi:hypothetical protein
MADTLSDERREDIWEALSEAFIDNEVDYAFIARKVAGVDPVRLEEIFFTEVAPYCGPNLMTPIPPVWAGFSRKPLIEGIREKLEQIRRFPIAWMKYQGFVVFCRWYFRKEWRTIAAELETCKGNAAIGSRK